MTNCSTFRDFVMMKTAEYKRHSRQNVHSHCRYCLHYTDNENINVDYNVRYSQLYWQIKL